MNQHSTSTHGPLRPLAGLGRIKVKLGLVIVLAVATAFAVNEVGIAAAVPGPMRVAMAAVLALLMVGVLTRGMTKPLRQMAAGAQTIARGRYDLRVEATSRDEVGELARAFNAMAADLGEVDRQRRELVANVSHELRTPITALRAVLENLVDGVTTPDEATLGTALAQTERLGRLVSQLLDLSRLEAGTRLVDEGPVDLDELCDQAAREAGLARGDVTIRSRVSPGLALRGDPDLLAQVLANLLDNAVRHSPAGQVVTLDAAPTGSGVRLTVKDKGPGIPAPERARVFERFSRLDAGRAADDGGTGLGLAITKEIVELHDGSIRVTEDAGCTMTIDLPGRIQMTDPSPGTTGTSSTMPSPARPAKAPVSAAATTAPDPATGVATVTATAVQASAQKPDASTEEPGAITRPAATTRTPPAAPATTSTTAGAPTKPAANPPTSTAAPASTASGSAAASSPATASGPATASPPAAAQAPTPPYVPPPLFPKPDVPEAPDWLLPAAGAVGVVAAISLPNSPPGLGLLVVAIAVGAAVAPALWRRIDAWSATFAALAYGLIGVAVLRDADWLVSLLLVAGFLLAALAISGRGRGWPGVIGGGLSVSLAVFPLPWFVKSALSQVGRHRRLGPALVGAGLTVVLLAIFGALFSSADAVFSSYASRLFVTGWLDSWPERAFVFVVVGVLVAAAILVALRPVAEPEPRTTRARVGRAMWLLPLTALNLLFATFVLVQLSVLFGGQRQVLETAGMTYAEYARSGFFQLVWISVFVLAIVGIVTGTLSVRGRDRWVIAGQLAVLCGLTLVVLASALQRLTLYVDMYGQSRVRASVDATIFWLAAVFALVLLAGGLRALGRGRATWLPRTLVAVTAAGMLAFAAWNPDLQVAQTQLNVRSVDSLDADYLGGLGAAAVPVLDTFPEPTRSCILQEVVEGNSLDEPDPWNGWNLARARARDVLARHPVDTSVSCTYTYR